MPGVVVMVAVPVMVMVVMTAMRRGMGGMRPVMVVMLIMAPVFVAIAMIGAVPVVAGLRIGREREGEYAGESEGERFGGHSL